MKKTVLSAFAIFAVCVFVSVKVQATPAALNFDKLPKDEKFQELFLAFGNAYETLQSFAYNQKEAVSKELSDAKNLYDFLNSKKKTNYDEDVLKLLVMRCLYNFDEISSSEMEQAFLKINKKYSKKAEHHWIYGNYLTSAVRTLDGKKELEKYLDMKKGRVTSFFLNDYAYALFLCGMPLDAYYTLTNGGNIPKDKIENQGLLRAIESKIENSSSSENYSVEQIWRVSQPEDGFRHIYSTMLGISFPVKEEWKLKFTAFDSENPASCYIGVDGFSIGDDKVSITIIILAYPESIYSEEHLERLLNRPDLASKKDVEISNKKFKKYTFENPSVYQDIRQGLLGYLYTAKIEPGEFWGSLCEHPTDFSKLNEEESGLSLFRMKPSKKRLEESVNFFILVDSCKALENETQKLIDELLGKAVFD